MDLNAIENIAADTAREAGAIIRRAVTKHKSLSTKSSEIDLLTEYDKEADTYIASRLLAAFPSHSIKSEESTSEKRETGNPDDDYVWHVDPIDGTINFVHGYPIFAVSLALYKDNQPLVAVVYDPMRDECFSAISGRGASLRSGEIRQSIHVSRADKLVDSLLATGFPYDRHHNRDDNLTQTAAYLKKARGLRRSGSAAIDLAYVAAGRLDGYWEFRLSSWDVAAGVLLVVEAGGKVTRTDGQAFQLMPQISLIASNGHIHDPMLTVLKEVTRRS
ncbi:MAG: inositol monophosphatase family protein [Candidatus Promineifilaceae bacterium]